MLSINSAKYAGKYNLQLTFNNGREGIVNLEETVHKDKRKIFLKLKDISNFKNFKVDHSTVVWFNELDLAPEYLFYLAFKEDKSFQDQFKKWGYIA
ncbi:hypothetical protein MNBD_GAMMA04-792 [hydrothermal vent metagenome]|uniref:DUF2442 domain-containing protein n=1 Tax=hydrothermal vent metagenome TaxID=652676 RepID=A0A3B0VR15_9ZZZZ